jgi:uncharacterized repeat protein (TIGR03803 family)
MKTQIQNLFLTGARLPRRRTTSRLCLPTLIALALLGLTAVPWRAQSEPASWHAFDADDEPNGTNNVGANSGGAKPIAKVVLPPTPSPQFRSASTGGDSVQGTLFGTASLGGKSGLGTVFALNTDYTGFTPLHDFTGGDGGFPAAGLILSGDTLYGTTENGGSSDNGTVFSVTTNGTGFKVLHNFTVRNQSSYTNSDGANPTAALILSGNMLYGTASDGGSGNKGTVFALNIINTNFTVLHNFTAANFDPNFNLTNSDGANPNARLLLSGNTLYGTASSGGSGSVGTVFAVNTNGTGFKVLHDFPAVYFLTLTNSDGANPQAGLILSGDMLYGTTSGGGNWTFGTVFAVNTNGTVFTNLYSFTGGSDGALPHGELILFSNALVGTASSGGDTSGDKSGDQRCQRSIGRNKRDVDESGSLATIEPVEAGGDQHPGREWKFHLHRHQRGGSQSPATLLYSPNSLRTVHCVWAIRRRRHISRHTLAKCTCG